QCLWRATLGDKGLFRLLQPSSLGGAELDPMTYIQVVEDIASHDASTGWWASSRKPNQEQRGFGSNLGMAQLSYCRHRFPPEIIQHAIWLYLRFTLSYRDVEELLAERGLDISYETVRRCVLKFGPSIARRLRQRRPRPSDCWHFDEMVVRIAGERMYLWRAV